MSGQVLIDGEDVARVADVFELRRKIGMVAPLPVGLPLSIYDNVAFAPRASGIRSRADPRRHRRAMSAPGGALGRGQGPAAHAGNEALRAVSSSG